MAEGTPDDPAVEQFFRVDELASILRVSRGSAYQLVRTKQIKSVRIGRVIRIPGQALEDFAKEAAR